MNRFQDAFGINLECGMNKRRERIPDHWCCNMEWQRLLISFVWKATAMLT